MKPVSTKEYREAVADPHEGDIYGYGALTLANAALNPELGLDDGWGVTAFTRTRDSGIREISNFETVCTALGGVTTAQTVRASHWGYGWIEFVVIKPFTGYDKTPSKALREAFAFHGALREYGILDESDVAAREHAAAVEFIEATVNADNLLNGGECLTDDQAGEVFSMMWDAGMNVDPDEISAADVEMVAARLGLWTSEPTDTADD
jgi:hypothetical protein